MKNLDFPLSLQFKISSKPQRGLLFVEIQDDVFFI